MARRRDIQAAINAARADLAGQPAEQPDYRKVNPADAPIVIIALTSKTARPGQMFDDAASEYPAAETRRNWRASGRSPSAASALPPCASRSIRTPLSKYGVGLEDVRAALAAANANSPKAQSTKASRYTIYTNDQANHAADYRPCRRLSQRRAVHLTDVAEIIDSVEDSAQRWA